MRRTYQNGMRLGKVHSNEKNRDYNYKIEFLFPKFDIKLSPNRQTGNKQNDSILRPAKKESAFIFYKLFNFLTNR